MKTLNVAELSQKQDQLITTIQSPEFINSLAALDGDTVAQDEANADPRAFLTKHGVLLPPGVRVTFKKGSWSICLNLGIISFCYAN
jgi:hypothetical protein